MKLKMKKITFKKDFSNFLVWSGITLGIIVIISELILSMIIHKNPTARMANPHGLWTPNGIWAGIWESLSTFSMQSIILITIFFLLVLTNQIYPNRAKYVNGWFSLAVTVYATITMIVFWTVLFKSELDSLNKNDPVFMTLLVYTYFLHLVLPLIIIIYYLINAGVEKWDIKKTAILSLPLTMGYMLLYLFYVLLKGTFVGVVKKVNNNDIIDYSYPYKFLNFKADVGTFLIYFFAILFGFLIIYVFYFLYNNWRNKQLPTNILKSNILK